MGYAGIWKRCELADQALSLKNVVLIGLSMRASIMLGTVAQSDNNIIGLIGIDNFKNLNSEIPQEIKLINVNYFPTDEDALKQYVGTNYTLSLMNGTCHYPMVENPAEFNALLDKLLLRL